MSCKTRATVLHPGKEWKPFEDCLLAAQILSIPFSLAADYRKDPSTPLQKNYNFCCFIIK